MKNKRASHVEIVISFIMFIGFVFFLYIIVSPRLQIESRDSSLDYVASTIVENSSANLTTVSVYLASSGGGACKSFSGFLSETQVGNSFKVVNENNNALDARIDGSNLQVEREGTENFFKVYASNEFPSVSTQTFGSCDSASLGSDYTIGFMKTEDRVLQVKFLDVLDFYNSNYSQSKSYLKIPSGDEFGFSIIYVNGTEISTEDPQKPSQVSIYSKRFPIIYVDDNGQEQSGLLEVRLWG